MRAALTCSVLTFSDCVRTAWIKLLMVRFAACLKTPCEELAMSLRAAGSMSEVATVTLLNRMLKKPACIVRLVDFGVIA